MNWQTASTIALTVITAVYVFLTWRLLRESQEARREASRPEVAISLRPWEGAMSFIYLHIENVGLGSAFDVQFSTNRDVPNGSLPSLREIGFMRKGVSYLAPGHHLEHFLASAIGQLEELKASPLEIVTTYKDDGGSTHSRTFDLDFGELEGLGRIGEVPQHSMAKSLEKIQKDLSSLASGHKQLRVLSESAFEADRNLQASVLEYRLRQLSESGRAAVEALIREHEQDTGPVRGEEE